MGRATIANKHMVAKLAVVVLMMFAFGYALVPLYRTICTALGINVLSVATDRATDLSFGFGSDKPNTQVDISRSITVVFDANSRGPWKFKPETRSVQVHPGQLTTVMYEFKNVQDRTMVAQAIPSYAPMQAAANFHKVECFCFTEHKLAPGESKRWPVTFVIDPKLSRDVATITLSYTFFEVGGKLPAAPESTLGALQSSQALLAAAQQR